MNLIASCFAFLAGGILALQVIVNSQARLRLTVDGSVLHPLQATFINFIGGSILLVAICLVGRFPWPSWQTAQTAPWWIWTGGALGILYLTASVLLGPRLGIAMFFMLVVAGQIVSSLFMDHVGLGGSPVKPANLGRILGAGIVIVGVVVVALSTEASPAAPISAVESIADK